MLKCLAMNMFLLSIVTISQLALQVIAISEGFIVPSQNSESLSYPEGSMLTITWNSTLDKIALTLWQDGNDTIEYIENASNIQNTNSWAWRVYTEKQNVTDASTFFLAIFRPGEVTPRFKSGNFKIVRASPASTLTRTPSSSSVPTSSPSSSISTSSPSSPKSDSGLNSRAKAELGLGLGIGIPFVLGLGILLGFLLRSGRGNAAGGGLHKPMGEDPPSAQQVQGRIQLHELRSMGRRELDSGALHELDLGTQPR